VAGVEDKCPKCESILVYNSHADTIGCANCLWIPDYMLLSKRQLNRALRRIIHEAVIQGVLRCPPKMSKKCSEYTEKTDCWYDYILAEAKGEEQ
jgi:hypothetical protein